jgi:MFS family permease
MSASMIFFVKPAENSQHMLIFISKIIEGISSSFIGPCLAALTLATFGPNHFDAVMASNALWGHVGSVVAAVIAGVVAYWMYPSIQYCFVVIAASALTAVFFVQFLPEGDKLMGRGFYGTQALDEHGHIERLTTPKSKDEDEDGYDIVNDGRHDNIPIKHVAASYWDVLSNKSCVVLCLTGFFFQ